MASTQTGWRWCNKCSGLAFFGFARCPSGGVHDHAISGDYTLHRVPDGTSPASTTQAEWRWCNKCQTLSYTGFGGTPAPCTAGGQHDLSGSSNYGLEMGDAAATAAGQHGWRFCSKCLGLFFAGNGTAGMCPSGGAHDSSTSGDYVLSLNGQPPIDGGQTRWRACSKCNMLAFDGYAACAGGGSHINTGSAELAVDFENTTSVGESGWRWCSACYSMVNWATNSPGACPARAGGHYIGGSGRYVLPLNGSVAAGEENRFQPGWKSCSKCQMAWSTENKQGKCPLSADSLHNSDDSKNYLVKLENGNSTANPTSCALSNTCSSSPPPTTGGDGGSLSTGSKAGIGAGVGLGVAVLAGVVVAVLWFRRKRTRQSVAEPTYASNNVQVYGETGTYSKNAKVAELAAPEAVFEVGTGGFHEMPVTTPARHTND